MRTASTPMATALTSRSTAGRRATSRRSSVTTRVRRTGARFGGAARAGRAWPNRPVQSTLMSSLVLPGPLPRCPVRHGWAAPRFRAAVGGVRGRAARAPRRPADGRGSEATHGRAMADSARVYASRLPGTTADALEAELLELMRRRYRAGAPLHRGAADLVRSLVGRVRLGVATSTTTPLVEVALQRRGAARRVRDRVVGCGSRRGASRTRPCSSRGVASSARTRRTPSRSRTRRWACRRPMRPGCSSWACRTATGVGRAPDRRGCRPADRFARPTWWSRAPDMARRTGRAEPGAAARHRAAHGHDHCSRASRWRRTATTTRSASPGSTSRASRPTTRRSSGCRLDRCCLDGVSMRRARDRRLPDRRAACASLDVTDSIWRDTLVTVRRVGALLAIGASWSSVRVRGGRLDLVDLSGAKLHGVALEGCVIGELDLGTAEARDVSFEGCEIGLLDVSGARLVRGGPHRCDDRRGQGRGRPPRRDDHPRPARGPGAAAGGAPGAEGARRLTSGDAAGGGADSA